MHSFKKAFGVLLLLFLLINNFTSAQITKINWNVLDDSITLTPNRFRGNGIISIRTPSGNDLQVKGDIVIAPKEKQVFFNDGDNLFKLKSEDISLLQIDIYKQLDRRDFANQNELYDSLLKEYRINLFNTLMLNEIEVLLTKFNVYELGDNGLTVKRPHILKGKICYLSVNKIVILSEEGELYSLNDGDFNYIKFDTSKAFECKDVYDYYYKLYSNKLIQTIADWKNKVKTNNLESLVEMFGPFDKAMNLSSEKKIFVWNKPLVNYQFNINSSSVNTSFSSTRTSYLYKYGSYISPLFYYGNMYRSDAFDSFEKTSGINHQFQYGNVFSKDESMTISLTTDTQNNILSVYQDKLFTEAGYGLPFRFIKF